MNFGAPWESLKESVPQLPDALLSTLKTKFRFRNMTPVQECTIPLLCQNKDIAAQAETGSGKTFAYLVPIIVALTEIDPAFLSLSDSGENKPASQLNYLHSLVLAPTQILAQQIYDVLVQVISADQVLLLIGGTDVSPDAADQTALQRPIAIATPGRLRYLLADGLISLKDLAILIIDEADQVVLAKDFPYIRTKLPTQRRTGLFSATFDSITEADMSLLMRNPHVVKLYNAVKEKDVYIVPQNLIMWYKVVPYEQKLYMLLQHINALRLQHKTDDPKKLIVFFMTCTMSQYMSLIFSEIFGLLSKQSMGVYCFNGKQSQETKTRNYNAFLADTRFSVLCTTDISARGLDISDIGYVLQFDPPKLIATYAHRAGRTARCYRNGDAGIFLSPEEVGIVQLLRTRGIPLHELTAEKENLFFNCSVAEDESATFLDLLTPPSNMFREDQMLSQEEFNAIRLMIKDLIQKSKKFSRALAANQQRTELAAKNAFSNATTMQKMRSITHATIEVPLQEINKKLEKLLKQERTQLEMQNYMYDHPLTKFLRELQSNKREMFEACQRACETWLSGYNENEAKLIFNIEKLPIGEFAVSLGLLKLPKHDILRRKHVNFKSVDIDVNKITYTNPKREENRQIQMDISVRKKEARAELQQKREQKQTPNKNVTDVIRTSLANQTALHGSRTPSQFAGEYRLLGMLKSGKITEEEFDEMVDDIAINNATMSKNKAKMRKWKR